MKDKKQEQMTIDGLDNLGKKCKESVNNDSDNKRIIGRSIETVMHESMIPYSEHVILDRALPRVEDGLKPVQRRILFTMLELGLQPDKQYRKSARIVGDCLGKYHPHGDSSVYDAMVRMAQNFNMGETLVQGHGNFGSVDGDSAAAMRYTEAKMTPLAMEMLKDLEKETVSWSLNFDDTLKEPDMLPAAYPNLLVNGSTGIAVGLATNIPPHNLGEVINGVVAFIDKPKITLDEMMKYIPAPDFPTGGFVIVGDELKTAYESGKGKVLVRAKFHIETIDDRKTIVITELPYQVNKAMLLQKIVELKEDKGKVALAGIQEIRDESDRNGMRAVIKLKKEMTPEPIINYLMKYTNLQTQYNINMVAIANGKPKQLGLLDIIKYYLDYRQSIIYKRSKYDLDLAKERAHIVEGLLVAIKNIDEVIKIIKKSASTTEAKINLKEKFELSDKQAQAILDMRLARLTSLEINKLQAEMKELLETIEKLSEIVNNPKKQLSVARSELLAVKKAYATKRKSSIQSVTDVIMPSDDDLQIVKDVVVAVSMQGTIKSIPAKNFAMSQKEFNTSSSLYEAHSFLIPCTNDKYVYIFTSLGNCFKILVSDIPEAKFKEKGTNISKLVELQKDEKFIFACVYGTLPKNKALYAFTQKGMVKKSVMSEFNISKSSFGSIKLNEGDKVVSYSLESDENDRMIIVTKLGNVLSAKINDIPSTGRLTSGVKAINLNDGDYVVGSSISDEGGEIITVTNKAYVKRTLIPDLELLPRYRKGVKITQLSKEAGDKVVFANLVKYPYTIIIQDINDIVVSKYSEDIPILPRTSGGKSATRSKAGLVVNQVGIFLHK